VFRALRKRIGLVRVRTTICGAAPMSNELFQYFIAIGVPITNAFGMTELHNIPSAADPEEYVPGTVGHVLPGWAVRKAADGEIQFRGPVGFLGYQGQSDRTGVITPDGWVHTGDLGEVYDNGCVRIVGRKKDVLITSGGKNVSPEYVENKLKASAYISEAIVIGDGRKYLTALIELDAEAVGDHLQRRGIAFTTLRDMAENAEVRRLVQAEIDAVNGTVNRVEAIKKFAVIPRDLSHDDGEMTPTRKVKRFQMERKFGHLIEALYAGDDESGAEAPQRARVH
jgi:long-chain acyl-CoA synthetase